MNFQPFELLSPLTPGIHLLEASAGTGKTYTIAALVLRLVAEKDIPLDQILVVTFTRAATAELRERIRSRLSEALVALEAGADLDGDPILGRLHDLMQENSKRRARILLNLHLAIQRLESAAIFTIHSFCQRTLGQAAFEAGFPLDPKLVKSIDKVAKDCAGDVFSSTYHNLPLDRFDYYQTAAKLKYPDLCQMAQTLAKNPDVELLPVPSGDRAAEFTSLCEVFLNRHGSDWHSTLSQELNFFRLAKGGARFKNKAVSAHIVKELEALHEDLFSGNSLKSGLSSLALGALKVLQPGYLARQTKPDIEPYSNPIVDDIQPIIVHLQQEIGLLRREKAEALRRLIHERMAHDGERSYGDILQVLGQEVAARPALRQLLKSAYKVALIDEFQDTDSIQWDIFSHILDPEHAHIYLIGDPKQAIYGFRGANINVYHKAAMSAGQRRYTMGINWRSDKAYVDAMNTLFSRGQMFQTEAIDYIEVQAAPKHAKSRIRFPDSFPEQTAPLQCRWLLPDDPNDQWVKPAIATRRIAESVAADIVELLNTKATLFDSKPISPGHIAVLVHSRYEGRAVKAALSRLCIPASFAKGAKLFDSHSTDHMTKWLSFLLSARDQRAARAAAVAPFFGWTKSDFEALDSEDPETLRRWEQFLEQGHNWRERLYSEGVAAAFYAALYDQPIIQRLLSMDNGERLAANALHILEFLHGVERNEGYNPSQLLEWLIHEKERSTLEEEASEMRLETDSLTVSIVTMHSSKGLEYPIVFLPYLWKGPKKTDEKLPIYADPDLPEERRLLLQLKGEAFDQANRRIAEENRQEVMRLLYVGFTRAALRCIVYGGQIDGFERSPLAALLFPKPFVDPEPGQMFSEAQTVFESSPLLNLSAIALDRSSDTLAPQDAPLEEPNVVAYRGEPFQFIAPPDSFTGMAKKITRHAGDRLESVQGRPPPAALVDDPNRPGFEDGGVMNAESEPLEESERVGLRHFPSGSEPGKCLHDIFESLVFPSVENSPAQFEAISPTLRHYGLLKKTDSERFAADIYAICKQGLGGPLHSVSLAHLSPGQWLPELNFDLQFDNLAEANIQLAEAMSIWAAETPEKQAYLSSLANLSMGSEHLKGAIDLVFQVDGKWYVADYKSNRCRKRADEPMRADHFSQPSLMTEMFSHHYPLQYILYSFALHRYLQARLKGNYDYSRDFGGVCYLFLRGMTFENGDGFGVFHDRLPDAAMARLDAIVPASMSGVEL